jgi:RNA polymerase sigma-70 factor (ECF subfamily)
MLNLKSPETISDTDVINKVTEGDTSFFEILIRKNNPFLYKTGRSYGFSHHDTEDLVQETFIAAYINLTKFQQRSSFKTWAIKIMLNLCYRRTRKLSFRNEKPASLILKENSAPMFTGNPGKDGYQIMAGRELVHEIEKALGDIPLEYRIVFSLRELNSLSTAETAEALDITETNVKVRLSRAKLMLREKIGKMYSPEDIFEFNLIYCNKITCQVMQAIKACRVGVSS